MPTKLLITLCLILSYSGTISAFTCSRSIIEIGDRKEKVYDKCGEPETTQSHRKMVGSTIQDPTHTYALQQFEEVIVDEWVYNFGSSRFKQYVRFENNIIRDIQELGRGN